MSPLDFSDSQVQTFEPVPAGSYNCHIAKVETKQTTKTAEEGGKLPVGTEYWAIEWRVNDDEEYANRAFFSNHFLITKATLKAGYDPDNAKRMKDGTYTFLVSIGYGDELTSGDWEPELDDFLNREARVVVGIKEYEGEKQNFVKRIKPLLAE